MRIILFIIPLILASCNPGQVKPIGTDIADKLSDTLVESNESTYPVREEEPVYPPVAEIDTDQEVQSLQNTRGNGILTGTILLNSRPVVDVNIFLAQTLKDSQGVEIIAEMDVVNSPRSYTNSNGEFTITNVPPGRYALILDIAVRSFMLVFPDTQESILVTVEADHINDLGILDFSELPIPDSYVK